MTSETFKTLKSEVDALLEKLKQDRDEVNLQMHLAKAEAREEWEELEKKWQHFQAQAHSVAEVTSEASEEVGQAVRLLAEELKNGYRKVRKAVKT